MMKEIYNVEDIEIEYVLRLIAYKVKMEKERGNL